MQALTMLSKTLVAALQEWNDILHQTRRSYYFLTYIHAAQLLALHRYINGKLRQEETQFLHATLTFISPLLDCETLKPPSNVNNATLFSAVSSIGIFLKSISVIMPFNHHISPPLFIWVIVDISTTQALWAPYNIWVSKGACKFSSRTSVILDDSWKQRWINSCYHVTICKQWRVSYDMKECYYILFDISAIRSQTKYCFVIHTLNGKR